MIQRWYCRVINWRFVLSTIISQAVLMFELAEMINTVSKPPMSNNVGWLINQLCHYTFYRLLGLICNFRLSANMYLVYIFHQVGLQSVPRPSFLYFQYTIPSFPRMGVSKGEKSNMLKLRKRSCVLHKNGRFLCVKVVIQHVCLLYCAKRLYISLLYLNPCVSHSASI